MKAYKLVEYKDSKEGKQEIKHRDTCRKNKAKRKNKIK